MRKMVVAIVLLVCGYSVSAQDQLQVLKNLQEQKERGFQYFYIEGLRSKLWGNTEDAFSNFQQCLQFDQDNALIYYELANLYFSVNQNKEGYQMLRKASNLNPENKWYTLYLANLYLQSNKNVEAAISFEKLLKTDPNNRIYIYRLASLYTELKEFDKALEMYDRLAVLIGDNDMIKLERQRLYSAAGMQNKNISYLKKEIKKDPNNTLNFISLGDTYLEIGDTKNAFKTYEKALDVDPTFGGVYLSLANYYQVTKDPERMIQSLKNAFESKYLDLDTKKQVFLQYILKTEKDSSLNPYVEGFFHILDSSYVDNAEIKVYYGNYLIGKRDTLGYLLLEQALHSNPYQQDVWLQILGYYLSKNDSEKVFSICNEALTYFPSIPELYFYKGLVYGTQDKLEEAIKTLNTGLDYTANRKDLIVRMLTTIGDLYYQQEKLDSTFIYYDKVLKIDPHNIIVLNNYAYFLAITNGDLDKAEKMSAKCVELEPGNITYLDTYAWIFYLKKDAFLSKFYIHKAIDKGGDQNVEILEHFGYILKLNKDYEGAKTQWKKAIELNWKVEKLAKEIEKLEL